MKAPSRDFLRLMKFGWTRPSQCWRTNDVCSGGTVGVVGRSSIVPTSVQFNRLAGNRYGNCSIALPLSNKWRVYKQILPCHACQACLGGSCFLPISLY